MAKSSQQSNEDFFSTMNDCLDQFFEHDSYPPSYSIKDELSSIGDRYSSEEFLAEGGMKKIYRVHDRITDRTVALAKLQRHQNSDLVEQFLREARLTSTLQHPNIIPVYDIGIEGATPFFTMELKSGASLAQVISDITDNNKKTHECYDHAKMLDIFLKVCDAISYAHSKGVIHLDIKPENIQIGNYGEVHVCDWGVSKIIGSPDSFEPDLALPDQSLLTNATMRGVIKGTPGYMAPEQTNADGDKTVQTDIYSLGAVLYVMLTFQTPVSGSNVESLLEATRMGTITPPRKTRHGQTINKRLEAIILKALQTDPQNRYATVSEFQNDITNYRNGFTTTAEHTHILTILSLLYKRNKQICRTILISLGSLLAFTLYFIGELKQSEVIANKERMNAEQERDKAQTSLSMYMQEKKTTEKLHGEIESILLKQVRTFTSDLLYSNRTTMGSFNKALHKLNLVLKANNNNLEARAAKGYLLFIMQRFSKAEEYFDEGTTEHKVVYPLCKKYAERFPGKELLKAEDLATLVREIMIKLGESRRPLSEKLMAYDALVRTDRAEHSLIVKAVLRNFNENWDETYFNLNTSTATLTVGGKGLKTFLSDRFHTSQSNLLRTLSINTLIFRDTDFSDLKNLSMLHLGTVDIRNSSIGSLPASEYLQQISTIIYKAGQLSEKDIEQCPKHITFIKQ